MTAPLEIPRPVLDRFERWLGDRWRGDRRPDRRAIESALRRAFVKIAGPPANAIEPHSAPTAERRRHAGTEAKIETRDAFEGELSSPRYRWEWSIDRMQVPLTADEYTAAARIRDAFRMRENTPGTVDWNSAGGSHPGPRLPIRDHQLRAAAEWNAIWLRLPAEIRFVVTNFILEQAPRDHEHPLDAITFGRMYGVTRDAEKARGVTVGAVRTTCAMIARLFREYDHWKAEQRERAAGQPQTVRRSRLTETERALLTNWGR